jgi:hypothetical protein
MGNVPRPLIGLLIATVVLFAVWTVALRPSSSSESARSAPLTAVRAVSRHAAPVRRAVAPPTLRRLDAVSRALRGREVLALLFYNPAAADDKAVKQELAAVPARGSAVFKLAVPIDELSRYRVVTSHVPVNVSPTLVVINRRRQASTIVGFADRFEIEQRVLDELG